MSLDNSSAARPSLGLPYPGTAGSQRERRWSVEPTKCRPSSFAICQRDAGEIQRIANALLVSMANTREAGAGRAHRAWGRHPAKNSPPDGGDRPDQLRRLVDDLRTRTPAPLLLRRCSARQQIRSRCQKTRVSRHWARQILDDSETTQAYSKPITVNIVVCSGKERLCSK